MSAFGTPSKLSGDKAQALCRREFPVPPTAGATWGSSRNVSSKSPLMASDANPVPAKRSIRPERLLGNRYWSGTTSRRRQSGNRAIAATWRAEPPSNRRRASTAGASSSRGISGLVILLFIDCYDTFGPGHTKQLAPPSPYRQAASDLSDGMLTETERGWQGRLRCRLVQCEINT